LSPLTASVFLGSFSSAWTRLRPPYKKEADVVEHPEVFDHVGLLVNKPPGLAGVPFA